MSGRYCKKKRSPNWTDSEVNVLLDIWKEYKKQLENSKRRNLSLYQEMSTEMAGYYCYRTAEEIRTKIDNMSKRFKFERTQELKGTKSEWRFFWQLDDILGLSPSSEHSIKDIDKKVEENAIDDNQDKRLMFKYPDKVDEDDIKTTEKQIEDIEFGQSHTNDELLTANLLSPLPVADAIYENDMENEKFFKEILQEYRETKCSLVETDKKIVELLSNQNALIKTQNEVCQTQNEILKALLEKMA